MRKITLRLESLAVESFHTTDPAQDEGTVVAHQRTAYCSVSCEGTCIQTACTCPEYGTCYQSCNGTCLNYSCQNSCLDTCATCGINTCEPTCGDCTGWC
jgi:hypothetical protein